MGRFGYVGTFRAAASHLIAGVAEIAVRVVDGVVQVFTATRAGGGLAAFTLSDVGAGLALVDEQPVGAGPRLGATPALSFVTLDGIERLVVTGVSSAAVGGWNLGANGSMGAAFTLSRGPTAVFAAHDIVQIGGVDHVALAEAKGNTLALWRIGAKNRLQLTGEAELFHDQPDRVGITDLRAATIGSMTFLLTLSNAEESLRVWHLGDEGGIKPVSQVGAGAGLGLSAPVALEVVQAWGRSFAVAVGAGSSSLSVVRIEPDGQMQLVDHVIDTLDTRFQNVQAVAVARLGGQVFLFAGGGDDGLQAFRMLPDGRLVSEGQILGSKTLAIDNITAIEAIVLDGRVELVIGREAAGLVRLRFDPGELAPVVMGGGGDDALTGDGRGDLLWGGAGDDTLSSGDGDDVLADGAGADVLTGGAGADLFVLSGDGTGDTIRGFVPGVDRIDLSGWGRVYSVQAVRREGRDDIMTLRWGDEVLVVQSADGVALLPGHFTSSDLFGLWHVDTPSVIAGRRFVGTEASETLEGGGGADTLVGSTGPDLLIGGSGVDTADYAGMAAAVYADLWPGGAMSVAVAGDRYDSVENLLGGGHDDVLAGDGFGNRLVGRAGADVLVGRGGADRLVGNAGNDSLFGGEGADTLDGGDGIDLASWATSAGALFIDLAAGSQKGGDAAGDVLIGIEHLIGSAHADRMLGDAGANIFWGGGGNDTLIGEKGDDVLRGGAGHDLIDGGRGHATLIGDDGDDWIWSDRGNDLIQGGSGMDWAVMAQRWAIRVDLAITTAQDTGGMGVDILSGVENLVAGSGNDSLFGHAGANVLDGGAGDDQLFGRSGNDRLIGGQGNDLLSGGYGIDFVSFSGSIPLRVDLRHAGAQDTGDGRDVLAGIEGVAGGIGNDSLTGQGGANRLHGGGGDDRLAGLAGHDILLGGSGSDWLDGGEGNDMLQGDTGNDRFLLASGADRINGGAGFDTLFLSGFRGMVITLEGGLQRHAQGTLLLASVEAVVGTAGHDRLGGNAGHNRLGGSGGNDALTGLSGNDSLAGGAGDDRLNGGLGCDVLNGGTGHDSLIGGLGADRFILASGHDRAVDFSPGQGDRLVIDDAQFRAAWGLSSAEVVQRFGHDLGDHVRLQLSAGSWIEFDGIASLDALRGAIEVI